MLYNYTSLPAFSDTERSATLNFYSICCQCPSTPLNYIYIKEYEDRNILYIVAFHEKFGVYFS